MNNYTQGRGVMKSAQPRYHILLTDLFQEQYQSFFLRKFHNLLL